MANTTTIYDSNSIASSGTDQTNAEDLTDRTGQIVAIFEGDANSDNLDIALEATAESGGNWALWDEFDKTGEDLTTNQTNNKCYQFDATALGKIRFDITNNNSSSTTLSVKIKEN